MTITTNKSKNQPHVTWLPTHGNLIATSLWKFIYFAYCLWSKNKLLKNV